MKNLIKISALAVLALMAVSCNNSDKQCDAQPECCQKMCPMKGCPQMREDMKKMRDIDEKWVKFDELSEAEQKSLISEKKALIDSMDARRKAAIEKMKADWENFDNLSIDEQKRLLDMKSFHKFGKKGCHKFGHKPCHKGDRHCCHKGHRHHKGHDCPKGQRPDCPKAQK